MIIPSLSIIGLFAYFQISISLLTSIWPLNIESNQLFFVISVYAVHTITYVIVNLFYYYCYSSKNSYIEQFKIEKKKWPWENEILWKDLQNSYWKGLVQNQLIAIMIAYLFSFRIKTRFDQTFPTLIEVSFQIIIFAIIEDTLFYISHLLLHTSYLYKTIHKIHHQYNVTVSWSAEYAHPIEYILGNLIPVLAGPIILGSYVHQICILIFIGLATHKTLSDHSGYSFIWDVYQYLPLVTDSQFHSKHHSLNTGNYSSTFTYLDKIIGTTIA